MKEVARAVGRLNRILPKRGFALIGPGRWGSRGDIRLGVPVTYADISNAAVLIEIARQRGGYVPDLSFGTHFFQDLVESSIRYLPLYPDDPETIFAAPLLRRASQRAGAGRSRSRRIVGGRACHRRPRGVRRPGAPDPDERRPRPRRRDTGRADGWTVGGEGTALEPTDPRIARGGRLALATGRGAASGQPTRSGAIRRGCRLSRRQRPDGERRTDERHRPHRPSPRPRRRRTAQRPRELAGRLEPGPGRCQLPAHRQPSATGCSMSDS